MSQHGARWSVGAAAETTANAPLLPISYDDADPLAASDTTTLPRVAKSKPNGVVPAAGVTTALPSAPSFLISYDSSRLLTRSDTIRMWPVGSTRTSAAPLAPTASGFVRLGSAVNDPSLPIAMTPIVLLMVFS